MTIHDLVETALGHLPRLTIRPHLPTADAWDPLATIDTLLQAPPLNTRLRQRLGAFLYPAADLLVHEVCEAMAAHPHLFRHAPDRVGPDAAVLRRRRRRLQHLLHLRQLLAHLHQAAADLYLFESAHIVMDAHDILRSARLDAARPNATPEDTLRQRALKLAEAIIQYHLGIRNDPRKEKSAARKKTI